MHLIASLIVRNEADRYLGLCLDHLHEFCDGIRVYDDFSTDETAELARSYRRTQVLSADRASFYEHEGNARQRALDWALESMPTHVLNIDADEFIEDGPALRKLIERSPNLSWRLCMEEVWQACDERLHVRMDGGWRPYQAMMLWSTAQKFGRMQNKQLACGRTPQGAGARSEATGISVLHFGWACEADRQARYDRYVEKDGGRFHASAHLASIMWPDERVSLEACPWPQGLDSVKTGLVARASRTQVLVKTEDAT